MTITTAAAPNDDAAAAASSTIDFAAYEFERMNKGLVRLLKYVNKSGNSGVSTRKACKDVFNSRTYGMNVIQRA